MKIRVNGQEVSVYRGAKVSDAVRAFFVVKGEAQPVKLPEVFDKFGNMIEPDGELSGLKQINFTIQENEPC